MGVTLFLYFFFILRSPLISHIKRFTTRQCTKMELIVFGSIHLGTILIAFLGVGLIAYWISTATFDEPEAWSTMIISKCDLKADDLEENSMFARKGLRNVFAPAGSFACIFGSMLYSYFSKVPLDEFRDRPIWKIFARFGFTIVICIPIILLVLIPSSAPLPVLLIFSEIGVTMGLTILNYSLG